MDTKFHINNRYLSKIKLPEEIGNLANLITLTVNDLIGELPQTLTNISYLTISPVVPLALPSNLCSLKELRVIGELLYIPQCLSSTLRIIALTGDQSYFFSQFRFEQTNLYISLTNMKIPIFSTWLSDPQNTSIVINNQIAFSGCTFQNALLTSEEFELLNNFMYIDISNSNVVLPTMINLKTIRYLKISYSNLTYFPNFINNCGGLVSLVLDNNNIRDFPSTLNCSNLTYLDASFNSLTFVPDLDLPKLKSLILNDNNIFNFPNLRNCNLTSLYFANNKLRELPVDFYCANLTYLDFSFNALTYVPDWSIPFLQYLYLNNNNISNFPSTSWKIMNSSFIYSIDLGFNNIRDFPLYFSTNIWLIRTLIISNNPINVGPNGDGPDFLTNTTSNFHTQYLYMQNINLTSVSLTMIQKFNYSLMLLDISFNSIQTIPNTLFNMVYLSKLIISNNLITSIPNTNISSNLEHFNISSNMLSEFNDSLLIFKINVLDISHNPITNWITYDGGVWSTTIRYIYMKNTSISTIPKFVYDNSYIYFLDLSDNPDLKIFNGSLFTSSIGALNLKNTSLTKFIPLQSTFLLEYLNLGNNPVLFDSILNFDNFNLNIQTVSMSINTNNYSVIVLSNTGLSNMINLTTLNRPYLNLDLSYNRITTFETANFTTFNVLNLNHNFINSFQLYKNIFVGYKLDLSYNLFTAFPNDDNSVIESGILDLSGNPLNICNTTFVHKNAYWPSNPTDVLNQKIWYTNPTNTFNLLNLSISNQFYTPTCSCMLPNLKYVIESDSQIPYCTYSAQPMIYSCQGKPPTPQSYCNGTFWLIPEVTNLVTPIVISGPTIIQGNLSLNSTSGGIQFEGFLNAITVQGCLENQTPIVINLSDEDIDKLSNLNDLEKKKKYMLIKAFGGRCNANSNSPLPRLQVKTHANSKTCKKVNGKIFEDNIDQNYDQQQQHEYSLAVVFNISTLKCKIWWIALISIFGMLIIVALITFIILYWKFKRFKYFISPFSRRERQKSLYSVSSSSSN